MQTLTVTPKMRSFFGGAFYPTHFSMVMYATESEVSEMTKKLTEKLFSSEDIFLVPPSVALSEIAGTVESSDIPLPSIGSDGTVARNIVELARQGHYGFLVRTGKDSDVVDLRAAIKNSNYSFAKTYYSLAIEDLE